MRRRVIAGGCRRISPVEQPTKFELLVNLKTARDLGLTVPREFLLLAR
jgi:putative ABC transport system substrate-binding protein